MSLGVWLVLALLIAANALYVAAEFAAVGVRRSRVRRLSDDGNWLARRLLANIESPVALDRYVGASQIGITVSSLMLGAFAQATITVALAPILSDLFQLTPLTGVSVAAAFVLVTLTATQLVLGELVPKTLALQYPTQTALATVLPMQWSLVVYGPFIRLLNGAALALMRMLGASEHGHHHLHSPEEIDLLIAESRNGGLLEPEEQQRLRRALHLGKRAARDLMVPLERLTMVEISTSWDELLKIALSSPYSRMPVYRVSRDAIIGTLRLKDLVDHYAASGPVAIETLMRPVLKLREDLPADKVLSSLRDRRAHSSVVIDAGGRAVGLVTIQDVLGEVLGTEHAPDAPAAQLRGVAS